MAYKLPRDVITPWDFGGKGDDSNDDNSALAATFAAAAGGLEVHLPPGIWTYSGLLALPKNATLRGQGYGYQGNPSRLKATHADARILIDDHCTVENLEVDGNSLGSWGVQIGAATTSKPSLRNVWVTDFVDAAYIFDTSQNGVMVNCSVRSTKVGYLFMNGAALWEIIGCSYSNHGTAGEGVGGAGARAILVKNDTTDPRLIGTLQYGGAARDLHFWGGIYENGGGDYRVEILDSSTVAGTIQFSGTQISQDDNATGLAVMHLGPNVTADCEVLLDNTVFATNGLPGVIAEGGRIKYRNHRQSGSGGKNVMGTTQLSGDATASYDDLTRRLIDSRFQTGLYASESYDWTSYSTGTVTWNATKKCADLVLPNTTAGSRGYFFGRTGYAQQYGTVTIRFKIAGATGPVRLNTWSAGNVLNTVGVFLDGTHEVVHEFVGGEEALLFTSDTASSVSAELRYLLCEHGAWGGKNPDPFTNNTITTAAGVTTLTVYDNPVQEFIGSTTQTVKLPTTGVLAGQGWTIVNNSSGVVTAQSSAANTITSVAAGRAILCTAAIDTPTTNSDWHFIFLSGQSSSPTSSTTVLRDGSANIYADQFIPTSAATATSAGTLTMTNNSPAVTTFSGSTTHTVLLPTTSVTPGQEFKIINNSTGTITVQSSGANTITTITTGTQKRFSCQVATPTTAAHWTWL